MPRFLPLILLPLCLALSCGCASKARKKPVHAAAAAQPLYVGKITLVNESGRFVLIDNGMSPAPPADVVLKSYTGNVQSGELETGNVRRHPFVIADIRSGAPQKGDRVFLEPLHGGTAAVPASTPAVQAPVATPTRAPGTSLGLPPESLIP